jgi:hypothetical protein
MRQSVRNRDSLGNLHYFLHLVVAEEELLGSEITPPRIDQPRTLWPLALGS